MKRRDHVTLGKYIWQLSPVRDDFFLRQAFMFGCTEPDTNVFTYFRGFFKCGSLQGHNKENAERHIMKLLEKSEYKCIMNVWNCFVLGAMLHYLADSFTFAHNAGFRGDIHEHRSYEWNLHYVLEDYLKNTDISGLLTADIKNGCDFWLENHQKYLSERKGADDCATDCRYIVKVCVMTFQYAFVTAGKNLRKERIMGLYENTDNHRLVPARNKRCGHLSSESR